MDRLKLIIAWYGFETSSCALAVAVTMVWRGVASQTGFVIEAVALGLFAISNHPFARLMPNGR